MDLDLTFSIDEYRFGKTEVVDLIPNGQNITVTNENRLEYVEKVCEYKLVGCVKEQIGAFLSGFHEIIPPDIGLDIFDDKELELLICGLPNIDLQDLKRNTEYQNYTENSPQIRWFWKVMNELTEEQKAYCSAEPTDKRAGKITNKGVGRERNDWFLQPSKMRP